MPEQRGMVTTSRDDGHEFDAELAVGLDDHGSPACFASRCSRPRYTQHREFVTGPCPSPPGASRAVASHSRAVAGRDRRWRTDMIPGGREAA